MNLGERMKGSYENRTKTYLPRNNYTSLRIDGKAFHTFTKGLECPFDKGLMEDMDHTAIYLCKNIMGAKLAYVQSDEISILVTDFDTINMQAWFDYNVQKMCSVSASMATRQFNERRVYRYFDEQNHMPTEGFRLAEFDSRVWQMPNRAEVFNYFMWRQQDCIKNSIQSVAQTLYSQKEMHGKHTDKLVSMMLDEKSVDWHLYDDRCKYGRIIMKETYQLDEVQNNAIRTRCLSVPCYPDRILLDQLIPIRPDDVLYEMMKCKESPYYFVTKYIKVKNNKGEQVPFNTALSEDDFNKMFQEYLQK